MGRRRPRSRCARGPWNRLTISKEAETPGKEQIRAESTPLPERRPGKLQPLQTKSGTESSVLSPVVSPLPPATVCASVGGVDEMPRSRAESEAGPVKGDCAALDAGESQLKSQAHSMHTLGSRNAMEANLDCSGPSKQQQQQPVWDSIRSEAPPPTEQPLGSCLNEETALWNCETTA